MCKRSRPAEPFVRLCARADRVGGNALEQDRDGGDGKAEGKQPPVRRWPHTSQCLLPRHRYRLPRSVVVVVRVWPGGTWVVVVVVVVVVLRVRPGGTFRCEPEGIVFV